MSKYASGAGFLVLLLRYMGIFNVVVVTQILTHVAQAKQLARWTDEKKISLEEACHGTNLMSEGKMVNEIILGRTNFNNLGSIFPTNDKSTAKIWPYFWDCLQLLFSRLLGNQPHVWIHARRFSLYRSLR